ncbi:MAG: hypothetical protein SFX73_27605 [Kofleriaceae bacterium]|nr:hypothetical protein [Kofleriaceae bacterium]
MRWPLLALVVAPAMAAAKPVWRPPSEPTERIAAAAAAELAADIRARNVPAITKRLAAPFTAGPLWFPDAACTRRFGAGGLVTTKDAPELARCLAKLDLQLSTRTSSLRDGAVLTAKPGFEIEIAFLTATSSQVRWLGSPVHEPTDVARPMLTAQAFEALRTHGTTQLDAVVGTDLDSERGSLRSVSAWVRVCLDTAGKHTATLVSSSSARTGEVFLRAIGDWQFQPFKFRATPVEACALTLLTYPSANAAASEVLPSSLTVPSPPVAQETLDFDEVDLWGAPPPPPPPPPSASSITARTLESLRRRGSSLIKPSGSALREIGTRKTSATAKVCIDRAGTVSSVTLLRRSTSRAWDQQIENTSRSWIFRPYTVNGSAQAACAILSFNP